MAIEFMTDSSWSAEFAILRSGEQLLERSVEPGDCDLCCRHKMLFLELESFEDL